MRTLLQTVRYGVRMLTKNPGFTALAVLTLALLASAGLLSSGLKRVLSMDSGFQNRHIVTKDVVYPGDEENAATGKDSGQLRRVRFIHDVVMQVSHPPNVRSRRLAFGCYEVARFMSASRSGRSERRDSVAKERLWRRSIACVKWSRVSRIPCT